MPLARFKDKGSAVVKELRCAGSLRQRLIDFGLSTGVKFEIKGYAPLGDPIIIEVNDCEIAIRRRDAEGIILA